MLDEIKTVGAGIIAIALMAVIVGGVFGATGSLIGDRTELGTAADAGETATMEGINITNVSVVQTLGTAASFDGTTSSYSSADIDWRPDAGPWTVSVWAQPSADNRTGREIVTTVDSRASILYNASSDQWEGVVVENNDVWVVSADATNSSDLQNVQLARDNDTLSLYQNGTLVATETLSSANTVSGDITADNFDGTVEETRIYNVSVGSSQRQALVDAPVQPLDGLTPVARIMHDRRAPWDAVPIFGSESGTVTYSGASFVDSFEGLAVSASDWTRSGDTVSRTSGSVLAGSPMYVSWEATYGGAFFGLWHSLLTVGPTAFGLLVVGLIVFAANFLMGAFSNDGF